MTSSQKKLHALMLEKGRLLTTEEAFVFYTENVKRKSFQCSPWSFNPVDYRMYELKAMADSFYIRALGRMLIEGKIDPVWLILQRVGR